MVKIWCQTEILIIHLLLDEEEVGRGVFSFFFDQADKNRRVSVLC